eukprot:275023-Alexandrium_andersonii.AAC.1
MSPGRGRGRAGGHGPPLCFDELADGEEAGAGNNAEGEKAAPSTEAGAGGQGLAPPPPPGTGE